jgi:hypothetical protein
MEKVYRVIYGGQYATSNGLRIEFMESADAHACLASLRKAGEIKSHQDYVESYDPHTGTTERIELVPTVRVR